MGLCLLSSLLSTASFLVSSFHEKVGGLGAKSEGFSRKLTGLKWAEIKAIKAGLDAATKQASIATLQSRHYFLDESAKLFLRSCNYSEFGSTHIGSTARQHSEPDRRAAISWAVLLCLLPFQARAEPGLETTCWRYTTEETPKLSEDYIEQIVLDIQKQCEPFLQNVRESGEFLYRGGPANFEASCSPMKEPSDLLDASTYGPDGVIFFSRLETWVRSRGRGPLPSLG
jgi:hypothetical protein